MQHAERGVPPTGLAPSPPGVGSGRASPSKPRPRLAGPTVHSLSAASINFKVSIRESARKLAGLRGSGFGLRARHPDRPRAPSRASPRSPAGRWGRTDGQDPLTGRKQTRFAPRPRHRNVQRRASPAPRGEGAAVRPSRRPREPRGRAPQPGRVFGVSPGAPRPSARVGAREATAAPWLFAVTEAPEGLNTPLRRHEGFAEQQRGSGENPRLTPSCGVGLCAAPPPLGSRAGSARPLPAWTPRRCRSPVRAPRLEEPDRVSALRFS